MSNGPPAARLARVATLAERTWEDRPLVVEFLSSRQPQLGDCTPLKLVAIADGAVPVERLLQWPEYGPSL